MMKANERDFAGLREEGALRALGRRPAVLDTAALHAAQHVQRPRLHRVGGEAQRLERNRDLDLEAVRRQPAFRLEHIVGREVRVLASDLEVNTVLKDLIGLIGFQRVRVPAFRDAIEHSLELYARDRLRELKRRGEVPPAPPEFPDLFDQVEVTIDPHQSIHGMTKLLRGIGPVLDTFGYQVVHNETDVDFITSDNPVSYYTIREEQIVPYAVTAEARAELGLDHPRAGDLIAAEEAGDRLSTEEMTGLAEAVLMAGTDTTRNQLACSVALFASHPDQWAALAARPELASRAVDRRYELSPVLSPSSKGFHPDDMRMPEFAFGDRKKLLKWRY